MHQGRQSEPTDGPKGGWSQVGVVFFGLVAWLQWSPHSQMLDVVWCTPAVVVVVA